jgi:hypothetical protein
MALKAMNESDCYKLYMDNVHVKGLPINPYSSKLKVKIPTTYSNIRNKEMSVTVSVVLFGYETGSFESEINKSSL